MRSFICIPVSVLSLLFQISHKREPLARNLSQSLIHQVCYSDLTPTVLCPLASNVAIPYSSGLLFGRSLEVILKKPAGGSQSLIHQVCYSDTSWRYTRWERRRVAIPYSSGLLFGPGDDMDGRSPAPVAIPYSSGLLFGLRIASGWLLTF